MSLDAPDALLYARRLVDLNPFDAAARARLVDRLAQLGRRDEAQQHCETGLRMLREGGLPAGELADAARALRSRPVVPDKEQNAAPNLGSVAEKVQVTAAAAAEPHAAGPSAPAPPDPPRAVANIIVVDDEPELGRMIADYLNGGDIAVRTCTGGRELDALLTEAPAELIILDVNMPDEDGFAIARRLQTTAGGPRILFLSSASGITDRVAGLELGADDYLTKPFDLRELRARSCRLAHDRQVVRFRSSGGEARGRRHRGCATCRVVAISTAETIARGATLPQPRRRVRRCRYAG
ncbi:MAG: response regulator [Rhodopila sp.]